MPRALATVLCLAALALPAPAQKLVGITWTPGLVVGIDLDTGEWQVLGMLGAWATNSLAIAPDGTIWTLGRREASQFGLDLLRVDPGLPAPTAVAHVPVGDVRGLAINDAGEMFALSHDGSTSKTTLVRIDPSTGAVTELGATGQPALQSLEFGPDGGLYALSGHVGVVRLHQTFGFGTDLFDDDDNQGGATQSLFWDDAGKLHGCGDTITKIGNDGVFGDAVFEFPLNLRGAVVVDELPRHVPFRFETHGPNDYNMSVYVFGAQPGALQTLLLNRGLGSLPVPGCPGVELALPDPGVLDQQVASAGGHAQFPQAFFGLAGLGLYAQVVERASCSVSDVYVVDG